MLRTLGWIVIVPVAEAVTALCEQYAQLERWRGKATQENQLEFEFKVKQLRESLEALKQALLEDGNA